MVQEAATLSAPLHKIGAFEAKTHLSAILDHVSKGESFLITKHGKPIAELKPVMEKPMKRNLGKWRGRIWMAPDFDAPLEDFKDYM